MNSLIPTAFVQTKHFGTAPDVVVVVVVVVAVGGGVVEVDALTR